MINFLKIAGVATVGVVVGLLLAYAFGGAHSFGGIYSQVQQNFDNGGLRVGPNGSVINELAATQCNLLGMDVSQGASTTKPYDCAITGVATGDAVFAQLSSTTPVGAASYWTIVGAKASTTANFVTVLLFNNGPAAVPSVSSVGSSTNVLYLDY